MWTRWTFYVNVTRPWHSCHVTYISISVFDVTLYAIYHHLQEYIICKLYQRISFLIANFLLNWWEFDDFGSMGRIASETRTKFIVTVTVVLVYKIINNASLIAIKNDQSYQH